MRILFTLLFLTGTQLTWSQESANINLLFHWEDQELPSSFAHDNTYNEIWGYALDDREYAIIGTTLGTHIFDVTDPGLSTEVQFVEGAVTGGTIVHRDYHTYQGYLYIVCDEGPSTLQIVDISGLPDQIDVVYDSSALFSRSHNIFIDEEHGVMYSCGGSTQFALYSLEDPENPTLLVNCGQSVSNWSSTVAYVHDVYVKDHVAYCNAENGLYIVDFSDPLSPDFRGDITSYPESGYNHSGWLHPGGQIYALADETHGTRIKILDVSDPSDIQVLGFVSSGIHENSIVHNLIFKDDVLHVSHYHDGYYAFDVTDPDNPVTLGYYDTSEEPHTFNYRGAWGVYPFLPSGNILVSDMQEGLFVFGTDFVSGIGEIDSHDLSLYPNPASAGQEIRIEGLQEDLSNATLEIYGTDGRLLHRKQLNNSSKINTEVPSNLSSGIYLLRIFANSVEYSGKLLLR